MMHLKYRNVNDAFNGLVRIYNGTYQVGGPDKRPIKGNSRNGPVLYYEEPVIITYTNPCERVLFNQARDANCFFHLYEALWMLAGRNDVAPLAYYASNIKNYSDDGTTFNGAYGYRWRRAGYKGDFTDRDVDQLNILINHLKADPISRRAVLQMWNVEDDLMKIGPEKGKSLDVCCNLSVMFSIREEKRITIPQGDPTLDGKEYLVKLLDMTVFNRSNDLIWGALGANVVHFSTLQEYMAAHIGVELGVYNQVSNNLHVYESNWKPEEWLADNTKDHYQGIHDPQNPYCYNRISLVRDPKVFYKELGVLVFNAYGDPDRVIMNLERPFSEPFLDDVARRMFLAFAHHKTRGYESALEECSMIKADDWRIAATNWITKRRDTYLKRKEQLEHVHEETC